MGSIISKEQSAFEKGRQILDCIVSLNGVFEHAQRRQTKGFCYKIDFAKAYDSIEWCFLWDMLRVFGFSEKWTMWMRECVETAHANVLVNGSPSGDFDLQRGLRQGDPIAPFLFIIAAESIGLLLKRATRMGLFEPLKVGCGGVEVSHLQFADDTIFLGNASLQNALFLKRFLIVLELVSGLKINRAKCQVISLKADGGLMEDIAAVLGCERIDPPFNYLGIRIGCRHKKAKDWKYVIDKVRDRLQKWRNLKISLAGRITLVNAVLSAVPLYALSVFKAPSVVLRKIVSIQQNFLWGGREGLRKIVWVKWDSLISSKAHGGLGLRDLWCLNKALLSKWGWRVLEGEEAVWVEVAVGQEVRIRGGLSGFSLIRPDTKPRGWWGDVLECLQDHKGSWFENSLKRMVGNGERTSFWEDKWASEKPLRTLFPRLFDLCLGKECSVRGAGCWENDSWKWGVGWRRDLREWEASALDELTLLLIGRNSAKVEDDSWNWKLETSGGFSVRSSYKLLVNRKTPDEQSALPWTKPLWLCWAAPKAQACVWRVLIGRVATKTELVKRGALPPHSDLRCAICGEEDETVKHLFLDCRHTWELWMRCLDWLGVKAALPSNLVDFFSFFLSLSGRKCPDKALATIWICVIWSIWKSRNEIVFNEGVWDLGKIVESIKSFVWSWCTGKKQFLGKGTRFRDWCTNPLLKSPEPD